MTITLIPFNKKVMEEKKVVDGGAPATGAENVLSAEETRLAELNAKLLKTETERDNYKKGMLIAKGKIEDDEEPPAVDVSELVKKEVQAALNDSDYLATVKERDELIEKTMRENRELRLAFKGKAGAPSASGSNQDSQKVADHVLSEEQERDLKSRGWDDKKIAHFKSLAGR